MPVEEKEPDIILTVLVKPRSDISIPPRQNGWTLSGLLINDGKKIKADRAIINAIRKSRSR